MPPVVGRLPLFQKLAFGVGHVMNDLCASMWFSYLLIYFHSIISFSNDLAGYVMLLGQIADGIATPLVGYEVDLTTRGFCGYTKRKSWHLIGTIAVVCSFPFIFNLCITCEDAVNWAQFIYYVPFVIIFQFGWATVQISHLSLIPDLTPHEDERVELNAIRYAFSVISNLAVYGITWVLLDVINASGKMHRTLGRSDAPKFRDLAFIVIGIGAIFSCIFHIGTKECRQHYVAQTESTIESYTIERSEERVTMYWSCWLKSRQFYLIALLYMCTRLIVNVSQIYLPMYLVDALNLRKDFVAIIPLVVYISGFVTSICMKLLNKLVGRKGTYFLGLLMIYGACIWFYFVAVNNLEMQVFGPAILLGAGGSTILVTSLSMTADLISENLESSAFVYGAMSFTDKLSNGIAVILIQQFHPCLTCCTNCEWYYRNVMTFVPGGVGGLALIILLILLPQNIGERPNKNTKRLRVSSSGQYEDDEDDTVACTSGVGTVRPSTISACKNAINYGVLPVDEDSHETSPSKPLVCNLVNSYGACSDNIDNYSPVSVDGSINREVEEA